MRIRLTEHTIREDLPDDKIRELIKSDERGDLLEELFRYYTLDDDMIDFAIQNVNRNMRGQLRFLYEYQKMSQRNIRTAMEEGPRDYLGVLYKYQKLNEDNINQAIRLHEGKLDENLEDLIIYQKFSDKNAALLIELATGMLPLRRLYEYQKLSVENIKRALLKHEELFSKGIVGDSKHHREHVWTLIYDNQISKLLRTQQKEIEEFMALNNLRTK